MLLHALNDPGRAAELARQSGDMQAAEAVAQHHSSISDHKVRYWDIIFGFVDTTSILFLCKSHVDFTYWVPCFCNKGLCFSSTSVVNNLLRTAVFMLVIAVS